MSSILGEGVRIVAKMTAISDDGRPVAIAWLAWPEEDEDAAEAFELVRDDLGQIRLEPCDLGPLRNWRQLAAMTGG